MFGKTIFVLFIKGARVLKLLSQGLAYGFNFGTLITNQVTLECRSGRLRTRHEGCNVV